jgi:hypothetical protein
MAVISTLCITLAMILNFDYDRISTMTKAKYMIMILTIIHMISIVMETRCRLNWMK